MDLHIFKFSPITEINPLRFLFNFEKNCIYSAVLVYINKSISAKGALVAVNNLSVVFSTRRFNSLYNCVLTNVAKNQGNKTEETNRQNH